MDNIDRIMREAEAAGYGPSYGKYMAAHPQRMQHKTDPELTKYPPKVCKECGMEFVPTRPDQIYCDDACRQRHNAREKARKKRRENPRLPCGPATCPICGGSFRRYRGTHVYCSRSCAAHGRNEEHRKQKRETSSDGKS